MAAETFCRHKGNQEAFHNMHNNDLALTKQIISAFGGFYLKGIKRRHEKFLGVSLLNIIQHLYNNYVTLNQVDIDDNDREMRKYYDPTLPIEVMFDQIEEVMEVTEAASCPYNKNQILQKAYSLIL